MSESEQEQPREDERAARPKLSEAVRKAVSSGFKAAAASDDWIRGVVADAMPREVVAYIKRATDTARDEIVRIIGVQTKRFLEGLDVSSEVQKVLTALSFEIKTEIRFIPNDQKVKPDVKVAMKTKRAKRRHERAQRAQRASDPEAAPDSDDGSTSDA